MKLTKLLIFLACACVDVQLRADSNTVSESNCWGLTIPCRVSADRKNQLQAGQNNFVMQAGSLIEQSGESEIGIVKGRVYIELNDSRLTIKVPFARVTCSGACKAIFDRQNDRMVMRSLAGLWNIERLGEKQTYAVVPGTQILASVVDDSGLAGLEFPQSLPWLPTVKDWADLYMGTRKEFRADIAKFRSEWKLAVEWVSQMQLEQAKRTIASYQRSVDAARARAKAQEREDEELRRLFRKKNYLEP